MQNFFSNAAEFLPILAVGIKNTLIVTAGSLLLSTALGLFLSHRRLLIARFSDFTLPVRARVPREHKQLRRELLHQLDRAVH